MNDIPYHNHDRNNSPAIKYDFLLEKLEAYGELYQDQNGPGITVTVANTFYPWINGQSTMIYPWLPTNLQNPSHLLYVETTDSSIAGRYDGFTIPKQVAGWYEVSFTTTFDADVASQVMWSVFVNNLKVVWIASRQDTDGTSDYTAHASGLLRLNANDTLELRVTSDSNGAVITPHQINFHLKRIAKLETKP